MNDLVEWLKAQLAEVERDAAESHSLFCALLTIIPGDPDANTIGSLDEANWGDWALCTCKQRMRLAEIHAKRRLLDAYEEAAAEAEAGPCAPNPPDAPPPQVDPDAVEMLEARLYAIAETLEYAVRLAALPLADRPGYQEEWRP